VIGMTGLLLDTELGAEQRHFAEVIRGSGDALLGVINDILDFSKIEAGRLELEATALDLRGCIESALELVAPAAAHKGIDLAYDLDPGAPTGVVGDLTRLRQILINLLNNAVKFTERGEVVVTVKAEPIDAGGRHRLNFAVRDTGIGIAEDRRDRLFESFSQVDPSTTRRYGGTGLGLAISNRLVELMGGTMSVESRPGEGSIFRFTIEAEAAPLPPRAFERAVASLRGKRVLIVDDNATNRDILTRQATMWGDGRASDRVAGGSARLDPRRRALRRRDPRPTDAGDGRPHTGRGDRTCSADLPLVMLTSIDSIDASSAAALAGYLTKPVRPSQLFDALMGLFGVGFGRVGRTCGRGRRTRRAPSRATPVADPRGRRQRGESATGAAPAPEGRLPGGCSGQRLWRRWRRWSASRTTSSSWTSRCRRWTGSRPRGGSAGWRP
jgi:CheY-like chemotaxis protein/anti-sigma regulatory factor (Ser/Thr protein kinase)